MTPLEAFTASYIGAALWSSNDDEGEPLDARFDRYDIAGGIGDEIEADCKAFYDANASDIHCNGAPLANDFEGSTAAREAAMAGHDFWLTRCGHGTGFWDGDWPEPHATRLDEAAKAFGDVYLYIGDDGKLHA